MNKIDTTKYLRQMKYLPVITPVCNIFLIVMVAMLTPLLGIYDFGPPQAETPEIKYAHYEPSRYTIPSVVIKKTGKFYLNSFRESNEWSEIRSKLTDQIEELQLKKPKKIMIYADAEASWGKIIDVLQNAKKIGFKVAGFMMEGEYSVLHYWETKNKYREKGLKYPEVDR